MRKFCLLSVLVASDAFAALFITSAFIGRAVPIPLSRTDAARRLYFLAQTI